MKKRVFVILLVFSQIIKAQANDSLTFSEIMFKPSAANSEFIELYNFSENTSYDLFGYHFKYHTSKTDSLIIVSQSGILPPHRFAVVVEGDYDFQNGIYSFPDSVIVLKTFDNAFGSSGMANSSDRTVRLFNRLFDTLSVYTYSADNNSGISDEKILTWGSNSSANWANSSVENGTPGLRNSQTPYDYDVSALSLIIAPEYITVADTLSARLEITNSGLQSASFAISFFFDINNDSTGEESERFYSENIYDFSSGDTLTIVANSIPPDTGSYSVIAEVNFPNDENISDNQTLEGIIVYPPKPVFGNIVINEIQYEPVTGEPEWVELQNSSDSVTFNLKNWRFADKTSRPIITDEDVFLSPKSFILLASDDGISDFYNVGSEVVVMNLPTLNNSGDNLKLIDSLDTVIDSVNYSAAWNQSPKHFSLERISIMNSSADSNNWCGSINPLRATPGFVNSVTQKDYDACLDSLFYSPDTALVGESVVVSAEIKNIGKNQLDFNVELNELSLTDSLPVANLETISYFLEAGDSAELDFSPFQLQNEPILISASIVSTEDEDTTNNSKLLLLFPSYSEKSVVINEIHFAPINGEPEWFELYNSTDSEINLMNWEMSDLLSIPHSVSLFDSVYQFYSHSKLIIAKDSSIFNYHNSIPSNVVIRAFPNLGNSEDGVVIRDANGKRIDSVLYSNRWGGRNGKSLERILSYQSSTDSTNWGSSTDIELSTPGRKNSITPFDKNLTVTDLAFHSDYITVSDTAELTARVANIGIEPIADFSVKFYEDKNLDSLIDETEIFADRSFTNISPGDTAESTVSFSPSDTGKCRVFAVVNSSGDNDSSDNSFSAETYIFPSKPKFGDVVINEIAYRPPPKHPEWIELYNRTDSTVFNFRKWKIADRNSSVRITLDTILFYPHTFAVLCATDTIRDFYSLDSGLIIVHIPSLNNSDDDLRLIDSMGTVIDSVYYKSEWNQSVEFSSLEKISPEMFGNDSNSWKGCVNSKLGTPGEINSVTQKDFDVIITDLSSEPEEPYFLQNFNLKCNVKNIGTNSANFTLSLYKKGNADSSGDILIEEAEKSLLSGDSADFSFSTQFIADSEQTFIVRAFFPEDEDSSNNYSSYFLIPAYRANDFKINEVHFAPIDGEPEWVEFQNCSGYMINLKHWQIGDVLLHPTFTEISDSEYFIADSAKLVIAKDSSILDYHRINSKLLVMNFSNLNNDSDGIVIKDGKNNVIDSLLFHSDWGNIAGASLERKYLGAATNDSTNWGSSTDRELSTPGRKNSIAPKNFNLAISDVEFTPLFPDSGQYLTVTAAVKNVGELSAHNFTIEFSQYNVNTRSFELFGESMISELRQLDSLSVTKTSLTPINDSLTIMVKCKYSNDEDTTDNSYIVVPKTGIGEHALTINEIMINPASNQYEWCEIFNNSNKRINLSKVFICDSSFMERKAVLSEDDLFMNKNSFLVVAPDSSFADSIARAGIMVANVNFGSLGNSHDALFLYDFRGNLIDSVCWNNSWNIIRGKSIEKVTPDSANIFSNWFPSLDSTGSTIGAINSVVNYQFAENPKIVVNEIMFAPSSSNSEYVEIYNSGEESVEIGGWRIYDSSGKSSYLSDKKHSIKPGEYFLFASDSNIFSFYGLDLHSDRIYIPRQNALSLGNNEDDIIIKDFALKTVDSVHYNSKWHNNNFINVNNRSLERISPDVSGNNPTNWSSCVSKIGGTPLARNSIFLNNIHEKEEISITPNPFSPDNDGFEDFTIIKYRLEDNISEIRIRIFDSIGRLVRTLVDNSPSGAYGEIIFDGKRDSGQPLRIGIYIMLIEEISNGNTIKSFKKPFVIARKF